jgi:predicted dehydrogenase
VKRFLVVGVGSVGTRHCRNLVELGHEVIAWDEDEGRLAQAAELRKVRIAPSLNWGLARGPAAVLVCTPPSTHVKIARQALEAGANVFVEKPLAPTSDEVTQLLELAGRQARFVSVGYNLRFLPSLRRVKSLLEDGRIGAVYSARAEFGFYLPAWRPGRDYRDNYAVSRELGGGILLDAIHELDYLSWMLGDPEEVFCAALHVSDLSGDTEDLAEVTLRFARGVLGQVHLDYFRRAYRRRLEVSGARGVIEWEYPSQQVTVYGPEPNEVHVIEVDGTEADMYMEEMKHLVRCLEYSEAPMIDGAEALRSLRLVEAAKESAASGAWVKRS